MSHHRISITEQIQRIPVYGSILSLRQDFFENNERFLKYMYPNTTTSSHQFVMPHSVERTLTTTMANGVVTTSSSGNNAEDYTASEDLMDISTFSAASTHTAPPTQNAIPTSVITPTSMGHWGLSAHDMHGGFVPPAISSHGHIQTTATPHIVTARSQLHGRRTNNKGFAVTANDLELLRHSPSNTRRRIRDEDQLSKDERDKRKVRRERNKVAAAKCRQRRVDHTNYLVQETEEWEESNATLEQEISKLQQQKEQLEFILEAHRAMCKMSKSSKEECDSAPSSRATTTSSLETPTTEIVTPTASAFSFGETCPTNTVSNGMLSPSCGSEMIKIESSSSSEMSSPESSRTLLQL